MENKVRNSTAQETDITSKSREEFINFLDSEISSLRSEIQRPGWTTWAILGSIAALVWLLLSEIHTGEYSPKNVAGLIFIIWLFCFFCMSITSLINTDRPLHKTKERFASKYLASTRRLGLILLTGLQIFFIFVAMDFSPDVGELATIMAFLVISGGIIAFVFVIAIIFTNTPMPFNTREDTITKTSYVLSVIISAIPLWFYIKFLLISPGTANIFDVRFAVLIAAISFLLLVLMFKPAGSLTLDSLIAIKREFFLGRLDLDTARRQVDIALTGLDASQAFEEYVSKLLSLLRDVAAEVDKCIEHQAKAEKLYLEWKSSRTKEQFSELNSEIDSIAESAEKARTIIREKWPKVFKPLQRRIYVVSVLTRNSDIFKDIRLKIDNTIDQVNQQIDDLSKRVVAFRDTVKKDRGTA